MVRVQLYCNEFNWQRALLRSTYKPAMLNHLISVLTTRTVSIDGFLRICFPILSISAYSLTSRTVFSPYDVITYLRFLVPLFPLSTALDRWSKRKDFRPSVVDWCQTYSVRCWRPRVNWFRELLTTESSSLHYKADLMHPFVRYDYFKAQLIVSGYFSNSITCHFTVSFAVVSRSSPLEDHHSRVAIHTNTNYAGYGSNDSLSTCECS